MVETTTAEVADKIVVTAMDELLPLIGSTAPVVEPGMDGVGRTSKEVVLHSILAASSPLAATRPTLPRTREG